MELKALQARIQQHAKAAYALLPETLVQLMPNINRETIERAVQTAQEGAWEQVVLCIDAFAKKNNFSPELVHELELARQCIRLHRSIVAKELMARTSDADKQVIGECIRALAHGPFIDHDGELQTVTGLHRDELARIGESWPDIENASLAVYAANGALNNILRYPHHKEHEWPNYISVSPERVEEVDENWRQLKKQIIMS
jgi:hypothetical protein